MSQVGVAPFSLFNLLFAISLSQVLVLRKDKFKVYVCVCMFYSQMDTLSMHKQS